MLFQADCVFCPGVVHSSIAAGLLTGAAGQQHPSIPASRLPDAHASTAQPLSLRLALRRQTDVRTVRIVLLIMDGDVGVKDDLTEPWWETGHSRFCLVGTFLSTVTMETPHLLVEGACSRSWYHERANRTGPVYREQTFHNVSCSAFYLNGISCFF